MNKKIRVAVTLGDPSGIGPGVILKALPYLKGIAELIIIGDLRVFDKFKSAWQFSQVNSIDLQNINIDKFKFGRIKAEYGQASMEYLDIALGLLKSGQADCLVTAPVSKEAISLAGYKYGGHTEYLSEKTNTEKTVMMLMNECLKFSLLTRHLPINRVAAELGKTDIINNLTLTNEFLRNNFKIKNPRMVVCGLNPHASDNGVIGNEERKIIIPAVVLARKKKLSVSGPFSADIAIAQVADKQYDCVIAAYHDQALIPLKLTGKDSGVNITLGLPFVRTSPLHGTAFDIAADLKKINPASFIAAVKTAIRCTCV